MHMLEEMARIRLVSINGTQSSNLNSSEGRKFCPRARLPKATIKGWGEGTMILLEWDDLSPHEVSRHSASPRIHIAEDNMAICKLKHKTGFGNEGAKAWRV